MADSTADYEDDGPSALPPGAWRDIVLRGDIRLAKEDRHILRGFWEWAPPASDPIGRINS